MPEPVTEIPEYGQAVQSVDSTSHSPIIRVWLADIRPLADRTEQCIPLLPPGRRKTAQNLSQRDDRLHSIAAGLLLRGILGVSDDERLHIGKHGKPALKDGPCFSLSHAGNYAALAVFQSDVGVDIEPLRTPPHVVPNRFLTAEELAWYQLEPTEARFCELWTRLESALKVNGQGLTEKDRSFSVVESGSPWFLETVHYDDHVISCAAGEPFSVELTVVATEELLRDQSGNRSENIN